MDNPKKHSVLLIDDSDTNTEALSRILSPELNVYKAKNGRTGIELAKELSPDVIILDIIMPEIDGFETITALKRSVQTRKIPVVFITGLSNVRDEERGLELGGADYITKPFSSGVVKLRINNQIRIQNYITTIKKLSKEDQLTGLANRRSFDERLVSEWKRAVREKSFLGIMIIDIDRFKSVNDTYGHLQGDYALQVVSRVIDRCIKRSSDFVARWGGEEFIALLPKTDPIGAAAIAEKVRKAVEAEPIDFFDGRSTRLTLSIGINSTIPSLESSVDAFLQGADESLFRAKADGRNTVRQYNE